MVVRRATALAIDDSVRAEMNFPTSSLPLTNAQAMGENRIRRLLDELAFAVSRTDRVVLKEWGGRSAGRLLTLGARRVGGLASLISAIGKHSWAELVGLIRAANGGNGLSYAGDRTAAAIDGSIALGRDGARVVAAIGRELVSNPKGAAPRVLGAFLGFYAGSGGLDGNGGIPDLDLLAGIDAHRSILTHSFLAGVVAEGTLLAIADLSAQVMNRLPVDHDPLWDGLAKTAAPLTASLSTGASAGIAYHLLVDAFIQPAPYHDLPFSMPIEGHQAAMAASGAAEGVAAAQVARARGAIEFVQGSPPVQSAGRKVVDGIVSAATIAQAKMTDGVDQLRKFWRGRRAAGRRFTR